MNLKEVILARVIVEYPAEPEPEPDLGQGSRKTAYAAGYIVGIGGSSIIVTMPLGRHEFSRNDGKWLAGDCLNYKDAAIMDFPDVEASVKAGYNGNVEHLKASLPMRATDCPQ